MTLMNALSETAREDMPPDESKDAHGLAELHAAKIRKDFEQQIGET